VVYPQDGKFVNEFKILDNIGKGAFSKVKRVMRQFTDEGGKPSEEAFAMKVTALLSFFTY